MLSVNHFFLLSGCVAFIFPQQCSVNMKDLYSPAWDMSVSKHRKVPRLLVLFFHFTGKLNSLNAAKVYAKVYLDSLQTRHIQIPPFNL